MHCGGSSWHNQQVLQALRHNTVLTSFTLRCLSPDDGQHWDVALALGQTLQDNTTIQELAVYSRTPSDVCDAGILMGLSRNNSTLQILHLEAMSLDGMGGTAFGLYLAGQQSLALIKLRFSDVHFAVGALGAIGIGLSKNKSLQTLEIGDCSFRGGVEEELTLDSGLAKHGSLRHLRFERNSGLYQQQQQQQQQVTIQQPPPPHASTSSQGSTSEEDHHHHHHHHHHQPGSKTFAGSPEGLLSANKSLNTFVYAGIDETNGDFRAIRCARALSGNASLTVLDLHRSGIRDHGAVALSKALLTSNTTLKELYLRENAIGDAGATAFGFYLARNLQLQTLDLQRNVFGDAGAIAIGRGLRKNSTLQRLYVARNPLSMAGYSCIFAALHENPSPSLVELGVYAVYVGVSDSGGGGTAMLQRSKDSGGSLRTMATSRSAAAATTTTRRGSGMAYQQQQQQQFPYRSQSVEDDRSDAESIETFNTGFFEKTKRFVPLDALCERALKDQYFNSIRLHARKNHTELLELEEIENLSPKLLSAMLRGDHGLYLRFDLVKGPIKKKKKVVKSKNKTAAGTTASVKTTGTRSERDATAAGTTTTTTKTKKKKKKAGTTKTKADRTNVSDKRNG